MIGFALFGCGRIGRVHACDIHAHAGAELVTCHDVAGPAAAALAAELPPLVMLGFNRRFDPSFRALRSRLAAGEIGRVEQVVITSRDPAPPPASYIPSSGGLFRDMTIHDFDIARYLAGDIVEVQAMRELDHFILCIEAGIAPRAGFAEGPEALRLADAVLKGMVTGRSVRLGQ